MRNFTGVNVTQHNRSRKAGADSNNGLANQLGARLLGTSRLLPMLPRSFFSSHGLLRTFWAKFLSIAVVELGLLLFWGLDQADGCECSACFVLGHFCTYFTLIHRSGKPLKFNLNLMHLVCLPVGSVASVTRSSSTQSMLSKAAAD